MSQSIRYCKKHTDGKEKLNKFGQCRTLDFSGLQLWTDIHRCELFLVFFSLSANLFPAGIYLFKSIMETAECVKSVQSLK